MIPEKVEAYDVISTVSGQEIKMKIDEDSTEHLMAVLSGMYSDVELAVIREYSVNAWDSHIEAGNTDRPIEITLPSVWSPNLTIQDYGMGLSADDIDRIYSRYGKSTKRDSNEVTGYLGIGSKSALAYQSQFTVTGIKDGRKIVVIVAKDEDDTGTMTIVSDEETDEENGVLISIPAKKDHQFEKKVYEFFRWWPAGSVKVNGQLVEPVKVDIKLTSAVHAMYLREGDYYRRPGTVVMGNVPYPLNWEQIYDSDEPYDYRYGRFFNDYRWGLIFYVPIGAVKIAPSREALEYTRKTKEYLRKLRDEAIAQIRPAFQREIEASATASEAWMKASRRDSIFKYRSTRERTPFTWRGQEIPDTVPFDAIVTDGEKKVSYRYSHQGSGLRDIGKYSTQHHWTGDHLDGALFVTGWRLGQRFGHVQKKKLWLYCDEQKMKYPTRFILVPYLPTNQWLPKDLPFIRWSAVDAMKLPKPPQSQGGAPRGNHKDPVYGLVQSHGYRLRPVMRNLSKIDLTLPTYYYVGKAVDHYTAKFFANAYGDGMYNIIVVNNTRKPKLLRLLPNIEEAHTTIREAREFWWGTLSKREKMIALYNGSQDYTAQLRALPPGVKDPELRALKTQILSDIHGPLATHLRLMKEQLGVPGNSDNVYIEIEEVLDKYPLLSRNVSRYGFNAPREHLLLYVNAAYEAFYKDQPQSSTTRKDEDQ